MRSEALRRDAVAVLHSAARFLDLGPFSTHAAARVRPLGRVAASMEMYATLKRHRPQLGNCDVAAMRAAFEPHQARLALLASARGIATAPAQLVPELSVARAASAAAGRAAPQGASNTVCLLYTSPSPRDQRGSRMPSSA